MQFFKRSLLTTAALIGLSGIAYAGLATNDSYNFVVYSGSYSSLGITGNATNQQGDEPGPTIAPSATFTYSGPINFVDNGNQSSQNLAGTFFGDYLTNNSVTNFFSPNGQFTDLSNFLSNDTLSNTGLSGSSLVTYMMITGVYTAPTGTTVTISHDDGASLYVGLQNNPVIQSGNPTIDIPSTAVLPAATDPTIFQLIYVEANGAPAVLQVTETLPVPEPGSFALLGTGLVGLGLVMRRRKAT